MTRAARRRPQPIRTARQPRSPESPLQRRPDGFMIPTPAVKAYLDLLLDSAISASGLEIAA